MEKMDRKNIITKSDGKTRGHKYKLKKSKGLKDMKKHSFPKRSMEILNGLKEETVWAKNIHMFKSKVDKSRCGDRTTRV